MRVRAGAATDIGLVRERNEDAFLAEPPLFVVADGMGGHRGGEVASRLALDTLERLARRGAEPLVEQVREANRAVYERSMLDRAVAGMGTTLTAALVETGRVRLAHVGDSRAYLLREGGLQLLTEDHTIVHRMVQKGELTEEEAAVHPYRSVLTRALGTDPDVAVDEGVVEIRSGDRLLLCTDGLTGMLAADRIAEVLLSTPDPQEAAERLVEEANTMGGADNTTVLVLDLQEAPGGPPPGGGTAATTPRPAPEGTGRPPSAGPAPTPSPQRERISAPRLRRLALGVAVTAGVLAAVLVGVRAYLDAQWFVGASGGRVAVYRGVPATVAGFDLHHVVVETDIPAADALRLTYFRDLEEGITADSREQADAIVAQIRADLAALEELVPEEPSP